MRYFNKILIYGRQCRYGDLMSPIRHGCTAHSPWFPQCEHSPQIVKIKNGTKCNAIRKSPSGSIIIGSMPLLIMRSPPTQNKCLFGPLLCTDLWAAEGISAFQTSLLCGCISSQWKLNTGHYPHLALVPLPHSYPLIIHEDYVNMTIHNI